MSFGPGVIPVSLAGELGAMRAVKLWVDSVRDKDQNPQWYVELGISAVKHR